MGPTERFASVTGSVQYFFEGLDSGLASVRTQSFTKSFPRCGVPDSYGSWQVYREYLELLLATGSIEEDTQVWWSVRPHLAFGTVEVRICDAQSDARESDALTALIVACVLQAARDDDEGKPVFEPPPRLIEENLWRAIRWGAAGELIDLQSGVCTPARTAIAQLAEWTAPLRAELGIELQLPVANGAERQAAALAGGLREIPGVREDAAENGPPIVSFTVEGYAPAEVAVIVEQSAGVQVRAGHHCAARIHDHLGTQQGGTVRASVGPFTEAGDIAALVAAVTELVG